MDLAHEVEAAFASIIKEYGFAIVPFREYETLLVASRSILCLVTVPREMEMNWMVLDDDGNQTRWCRRPRPGTGACSRV